MKQMIEVAATAVIPAPPKTVYAILADYHQGHPAILPPTYFKELTVLSGGKGAGTVIRVRMATMGVAQTFQMRVSEPEPGRTLIETDEAKGTTTSFILDPINDDQHTRLTIKTQSLASPGLKGWFERLLTPGLMKRIFQEQFELIAKYVQQN